MPPSRQFGCVALLDALGTRTASVEQTESYLDSLKDIRTVLSEFDVTGQDEHPGRARPEHPGGDFRVRFFSDTILITLPFEADRLNWVPVARMFAGASSIVATALARGILFRGAISVGEYIETDDAVLGPAILDAAHWYERAEMFGVIATPKAMFSINTILSDPESVSAMPVGGIESLGVPYIVPLNNGKDVPTHVADWTFSARVRSGDAASNLKKWLYTTLQDCLVAPGVEAKYRNSFAFFEHCEGLRDARMNP